MVCYYCTRWIQQLRSRSGIIGSRDLNENTIYILIIVQRDATQSSLFIILQVHSTCFGCQRHPSSGVHKTVNTASGTDHNFLCIYLPPTWPSLATLEGGSCTVPEAVVTVLCTTDNGLGWHPKHVEWTCRIINSLLCVALRWTVINISDARNHMHKIYSFLTRSVQVISILLQRHMSCGSPFKWR